MFQQDPNYSSAEESEDGHEQFSQDTNETGEVDDRKQPRIDKHRSDAGKDNNHENNRTVR